MTVCDLAKDDNAESDDVGEVSLLFNIYLIYTDISISGADATLICCICIY